jgi:hypothetical protein
MAFHCVKCSLRPAEVEVDYQVVDARGLIATPRTVCDIVCASCAPEVIKSKGRNFYRALWLEVGKLPTRPFVSA